MSQYPPTVKRQVINAASYNSHKVASSPRLNNVSENEPRALPNISHFDSRPRAESITEQSDFSLHAGGPGPAGTPSRGLQDVSSASMPARTSAGVEANERRTIPDSDSRSFNSGRSPSTERRTFSRSSMDNESFELGNSSLPALQTKGHVDDNDVLEPLMEEEYEDGSFDLVAPAHEQQKSYSLEERSELLFSSEHLRMIFEQPHLLLRFTTFLNQNRQKSIPILIYYLDAVKALKAIGYANAIVESLDPIPNYDFTDSTTRPTVNHVLEDKARQAFDVLVREDLPAYITHIWTQTVSLSITKRISGTLPLHLREASEGLAEVFCLTDPSRQDNPIVFASEEFHRTTQYGMNYVIGRNCRFLQGPKTNPFSVRRLRSRVEAGLEHCEVFLNYRRDGSPFMNLLMTAPLCDSRGKIRYFIGAQVDISGLVKECSDLESLSMLVKAQEPRDITDDLENKKDEFQQLSEMLNMQELNTVRRFGGLMHREQQEEIHDSNGNAGNWNRPRLLIHDGGSHVERTYNSAGNKISGRLSGVYEHYLLVRPYPSLRILFASPSLRVPGILQSPFMAKIGGSPRVREELTQALADGRGVTAKVRWVTKNDVDGRNRWIHCTPLLGSNGAIGVWMVVIVDDEKETMNARRFRQAPPVDTRIGRANGNERVVSFEKKPGKDDDDLSLRAFAMQNGADSGDTSVPSQTMGVQAGEPTRNGSIREASSKSGMIQGSQKVGTASSGSGNTGTAMGIGRPPTTAVGADIVRKGEGIGGMNNSGIGAAGQGRPGTQPGVRSAGHSLDQGSSRSGSPWTSRFGGDRIGDA